MKVKFFKKKQQHHRLQELPYNFSSSAHEHTLRFYR